MYETVISPPKYTTESASSNPGNGSDQSAKVRTGTRAVFFLFSRQFRWHPASRRKLREVFDRDHFAVAAEGLCRIAKLYAIEAEIRGASPEQRLAEHQARTAPLIDVFGVWLRQHRARISDKSNLGQKLTYIDWRWDRLGVFLRDGRVEIDSKAVGNSIQPLALTRKNTLFAGYDAGAAAWGRIASLIEITKMNGVEPSAYLKATLEVGHAASKFDDLLPWAFTPAST